MEQGKREKLLKSIKNLEDALREYSIPGSKGDLPFLALCKAMEVVVEYCWKEMKYAVEAQGLFAPSPREAIRQAATLGLIDDPEKWQQILTARNDSVHDYFGIPERQYVEMAQHLLVLSGAFANCKNRE